MRTKEGQLFFNTQGYLHKRIEVFLICKMLLKELDGNASHTSKAHDQVKWKEYVLQW